MKQRITLLTMALALVAAACSTDTGTTVAAATDDVPAASVTDGATDSATADGGSTDSASTQVVVVSTDGDDCPDEVFLVDEVNAYEQSDGYADPELSVTCNGDSIIVATNNMPTFEFVQMTPNELQAQDYVYEIPLEPVEADTPGAAGLGAIGVTITGLNVFAAFEAPQDGYRDPLLDGLLDYCNGHTAQQGVYHFHASPDCIVDTTEVAGLVLGYAFDGYEMVTPWVCANDDCTEITEVTSSYVRTDPNGLGAFDAWEYQEGSGDLDECNGMVGADGVYRYYVTNEFPYVPFCFHGETDWAQGDFTGDAPAGGAPADAGAQTGGPAGDQAAAPAGRTGPAGGPPPGG